MKFGDKPVIFVLIAINVAMYLLFVSVDSLVPIYEKYCTLWKWDVFIQRPPPRGMSYNSFQDFNPVQLLGSMFSHSLPSPIHLLVNMMVLYFFGPAVCTALGRVRFILFYLFCGIVGGLLTALFDPTKNPVVGASGALCGLIVGAAWFFPPMRIGILFIPVYIKSRIFVSIFFTVSVILIVLGLFIPAKDMPVSLQFVVYGISHFGHAAGMVAGAFFLVLLRLAGGPDAVRPWSPRSPPNPPV